MANNLQLAPPCRHCHKRTPTPTPTPRKIMRAFNIIFFLFALGWSSSNLIHHPTSALPIFFHHSKFRPTDRLEATPTTWFQLDAYFDAMSNPKLYSSSMYGEVTPDIQTAIYKHQHPPSCTPPPSLDAVRKQDKGPYFLIWELWPHGFGSVLFGHAIAMNMALSSGRILLVHTGNAVWEWARDCERPHPECYFEPLSSCDSYTIYNDTIAGKWSKKYLTDTDTVVPPAESGQPQVVLASGKLNWLGNFKGDKMNVVQSMRTLNLEHIVNQSIYFRPNNRDTLIRSWVGQAILYSTRLQPRLRAKLRSDLIDVLSQYFSADPKTDERGKAFVPLDLRELIGVPVRKGDKCYEKQKDGTFKGEMECIDLPQMMDTATRIRTMQPWVRNAIITSEDASALIGVDRYKNTWNIIQNTKDIQFGSGSVGHVAKGLHEKDTTMKKSFEAMLLSYTLQLLPSYHVLAPRSNFANVINVMAKLVPGKLSHFTYHAGMLSIPF